MKMLDEHGSARPGVRQWVASAAFLALAAYLWFQYGAVLALLPLALGLACPLTHRFRHRRSARGH
jgi:hypothetical protein